MNTGFVLGSAFGGALASTLLMFALSALALQSQRKAKIGWRLTLLLFVVAVAIVTVINAVLFFSAPSLLTSSEMTVLSIFQGFIIPLGVSVVVLLFLWKPKAD